MIIPNEKTAISVMKHVAGYSIIGLAASVVTLFYLFIRLNNWVRDDLQKTNLELKAIVAKNTQTISDLRYILISDRERVREAQAMGEQAAKDFMKSLADDKP